MKVGAVLFDTDNSVFATDQKKIISLQSAWASVDGKQARRIQSIHELPSDVLWFTNLTFNNFYQAGLHRHPNFRNNGWLRTLFRQLVSELGVENASPNITVSTIATIAQRIIDVARAKYGVDPKYKRLNEDFAIALKSPRSALPDCFYTYFEAIADHPSVSVIQNVNFNVVSSTVTVRHNRLQHAKLLLNYPVPPDTHWELEKTIPPSRSDKWLEKIETPFLVKCSVSNIKPMIAEVLSWGSGSRNAREWLTDVEWRVVRQYGDVSVNAALVCSQPAKPLAQAKLLPSNPFAELSVTLGLIAEQIWTAMAAKQPYKNGQNRYTAAAAWIRAIDRMAMFEFAQRLYGKGLNIACYGAGNVVVRYPEGGLRRALDISTDVGLMPPASKFAEVA